MIEVCPLGQHAHHAQAFCCGQAGVGLLFPKVPNQLVEHFFLVVTRQTVLRKAAVKSTT